MSERGRERDSGIKRKRERERGHECARVKNI